VTPGARIAVSVALALMGGCIASSVGTVRATPASSTASPARVVGSTWVRLAEEQSSTLRAFTLLDEGQGVTFAVLGPKPGQPPEDALHTDVRAWALEGGPLARRLPDRTLTLSSAAREPALGSIDRHVLFAATNDNDVPGYVGEYGGTDGAIHGAPLALSEIERAQVVVPLGKQWSTRTLPCGEWLFSPRVQSIELAGAPVVTFGTADGHVAVFRYELSPARGVPLALVPRAVDAVLLAAPAGGGARVYHRVPDARWSGYEDSQLAWSRGPVALPFRMLEIDESGAVTRPAAVVNPVIGESPVLAFDAARAPDGTLVVAVVRGDLDHPAVATFRIDESRGTTAFPPFDLGAMPVAIRLAVTRTAVFAAVLTRRDFVRVADVYTLPLR
jgi:hypothetical protein